MEYSIDTTTIQKQCHKSKQSNFFFARLQNYYPIVEIKLRKLKIVENFSCCFFLITIF